MVLNHTHVSRRFFPFFPNTVLQYVEANNETQKETFNLKKI